MAKALLVCWKCGASLEQEPLPLARLAECRACHADLHVCRLCEFFAPRVARQCREPVAEEVQDKERANFCDYFQPRPDAFIAPDTQPARTARRQLETLFGDGNGARESDDEASASDSLRKPLDDLFDS
ncbi:MAG: hypothetical protein PVJ15_00905 [Gammaproteobacteria bacterium]|jgi:hypothetical protein